MYVYTYLPMHSILSRIFIGHKVIMIVNLW